MKKTTILSVRAVLWLKKLKDKRLKLKALVILVLLYFIMGSLHAQENKAIDVTLKGIQIGQQVPDVTINGLHNYKDANGKPATIAKLSDFRGKLLILDFWATWCAPCVAMIPKMDSLQHQFNDQLQILSVTYQTEKEVMPFLAKLTQGLAKRTNLPVVTGQKQLHLLFPHVYLPHYVWIDANGLVLAITGAEQLTAVNVKAALLGKSANLIAKKDISINYNTKQILLAQNLFNASEQLFYGFLGKAKQGLRSRLEVTRTDTINGVRITLTNTSLAQLYQQAHADFGSFDSRNTVFEVTDINLIKPAKEIDIVAWRQKYAFCYERQLNYARAKDLYPIVRADLRNYFPQYEASLQKKTVKCLALVATADSQKYVAVTKTPLKMQLATDVKTFDGVTFEQFIRPLFEFYLQKIPYPIVNDTGYHGPIKLELDAELRDLASINKALANYGLRFEEKLVATNVLVIKEVGL